MLGRKNSKKSLNYNYNKLIFEKKINYSYNRTNGIW